MSRRITLCFYKDRRRVVLYGKKLYLEFKIVMSE